MPPDSNEAFARLQQQLQAIWASVRDNDSFSHTSLIVPSLSVDQEELSKVQGASFYEERLLFALIRLRNPNARLIYVTSQPVHPDVVDYYLQLLVGVVLYAVSPVVKGLAKDHYFAYLHPLLMILAIAGVHIVHARNKKSEGANPREVAVGIGLTLLLLLLAIPWQRAIFPGM